MTNRELAHALLETYFKHGEMEVQTEKGDGFYYPVGTPVTTNVVRVSKSSSRTMDTLDHSGQYVVIIP